MVVISLQHSVVGQMSRAAFKAIRSQFRRLRLAPVDPRWPAKAEICLRCPLRVIEGKTVYCGKPYLHKPDRVDALDGCGCPVNAKAKDRTEHCPINWQHTAAAQPPRRCDCKWCVPSLQRG